MTKIKYRNAQTDQFHQNDAKKSFNVIFVKWNANDEKKSFLFLKLTIFIKIMQKSVYTLVKIYFSQLDEIKHKFAQTGNFYNNDENKYFLSLIFIIYHKCTKRNLVIFKIDFNVQIIFFISKIQYFDLYSLLLCWNQ